MEALRILSILSVIGKEDAEFVGIVNILLGLSESNMDRPKGLLGNFIALSS